jgi:hypothetical protein
MRRYPGTINLTEGTYRTLLTEIASSLAQHSFEHIVLIGEAAETRQDESGREELSAKRPEARPRSTSIPSITTTLTYKWADQAFGWEEKVEGSMTTPPSPPS